jgi:hypothetical protein
MPPRYFAPPPLCWSGRPPVPAALQRHATFAPLRVGAQNRTPAGDELVRVQGESFLLKTAARGLHVMPDGLYNFVRTVGDRPSDRHTLVSPRSSHAGLANGRPVLFAGTIRFDSGRLEWWSNYSGTYQPVAAFRQQAGLPDERFVPWQRLQMGGIGLQRTMLGENRPSARPEPAAKTGTVAKTEPAVKTGTTSKSEAVAKSGTGPDRMSHNSGLQDNPGQARRSGS